MTGNTNIDFMYTEELMGLVKANVEIEPRRTRKDCEAIADTNANVKKFEVRENGEKVVTLKGFDLGCMRVFGTYREAFLYMMFA